MKTTSISQSLGVTPQIIRRWVSLFGDFLSETSKRRVGYQATYTADDILILATIHYLSQTGHKMPEIRERLDAGYRLEDLAGTYPRFAFVDLNPVLPEGRKPTPPEMEKMLKQATIDRKQLQEKLDKSEEETRDLKSINQALHQQISELQYRLGLAEGELNVLRRQLENKA